METPLRLPRDRRRRSQPVRVGRVRVPIHEARSGFNEPRAHADAPPCQCGWPGGNGFSTGRLRHVALRRGQEELAQTFCIGSAARPRAVAPGQGVHSPHAGSDQDFLRAATRRSPRWGYARRSYWQVLSTKQFMSAASSTEPLVSVVIPTFNRPSYLREAIASALRQTYSNFEVLVCDNASTDETRQVVESFSDPRLRYRRHSRNVGPTENVIGGCRETRGEFIANLHDDDVWEPSFLEKLVPVLRENPSAAIAFSDHYIINASGTINLELSQKNSCRWKRDVLTPGLHQPLHRIALLDKSVPLSMAAVMRRSAIDWNDIPDLPSCYDLWLLY